jgi:aryl-alcohol dehydrogenase-like predicted oxidoreductase
MGEGPNDIGLSAYNIRKSCEDSLRRLQTDHIDLYQMHHIDRNTPWEEIWQAMERLVREGKIIYVGSSNFAGWNISQAQCIASSRHFMGLVSEQSLYNLCDRMIELEVIPACREYGIGIIPWSPLKEGLLAGILQRKDKKRSSRDRIEKLGEKFNSQLQLYESFCKELGEKPSNIALAWLIHNPIVTAPIIGPRTIDQLVDSVRSLDIELSENRLKKLDEIWPGPGGEAPEAYAW